MQNAHAPTSQWTELASAAVRVRPVYLVRQGELYVFSLAGPPDAGLVDDGSGLLRVDDAPQGGRRVSATATGRLRIF